jgi:hypothetical protein
MDELTLLREIEAETPPPGPYARHVARARLQSEIEAARVPRSRPPVARLVLACAAFAAAAAIVVAIADPGHRAPEPPIQLTSAATTLLVASRATADDRVVVPRDGQYYYLKEVLVETPVGGGERETFVDESWLAVGGNYLSLTSERGRAWMAKDNWLPRRYSDLEKLPTDPAQLLLYVRSWPDDGRAGDEPMSADDYETSYMFLTMLLRGAPVMPPRLRAATFGALARIPGVEITEDRLSPRGPHALAIRRRGRWPWQALVVSRGSYTYLGMRDLNVREDGVKVRQVRRLVRSGLVDRIRQRPAS